MSTKILIAVVILLFTMIIASSIASILPLVIPSITSSLYCPSSHTLTVDKYRTFSVDQDRTGLYITCLQNDSQIYSSPNEFLNGYGKIAGSLSLFLLIPASFIYAKVISHNNNHHRNNWQLFNRTHYFNHRSWHHFSTN